MMTFDDCPSTRRCALHLALIAFAIAGAGCGASNPESDTLPVDRPASVPSDGPTVDGPAARPDRDPGAAATDAEEATDGSGLVVLDAQAGIELPTAVVPGTLARRGGERWLATAEGTALVPVGLPVEDGECVTRIDPMVAIVAPATPDEPRVALALYTDDRSPEVWSDDRRSEQEEPCWRKHAVFVDVTAETDEILAVDTAEEPVAFDAVDAFPGLPGPEVISLGLEGIRIDPSDGPGAIPVGKRGVPVRLADASSLSVTGDSPWLASLRPVDAAVRIEGDATAGGDRVSDAWLAAVPVFTDSGVEHRIATTEDIETVLGIAAPIPKPESDPDLTEHFGRTARVRLGRQEGALLVDWSVNETYDVSGYGEESSDANEFAAAWLVLDDDLRRIPVRQSTGGARSMTSDHGGDRSRTEVEQRYHWVASTLPDDPTRFEHDDGVWIEHEVERTETTEGWWSFGEWLDVEVDGSACNVASGTSDTESTTVSTRHLWSFVGPDGRWEIDLGGDVSESIREARGSGTITSSDADALIATASHDLPGLGTVRLDLTGSGGWVQSFDHDDRLVVSGACETLVEPPFDLAGTVSIQPAEGGLYLVFADLSYESPLASCTDRLQVWWRPGIGIVDTVSEATSATVARPDTCIDAD